MLLRLILPYHAMPGWGHWLTQLYLKVYNVRPNVVLSHRGRNEEKIGIVLAGRRFCFENQFYEGEIAHGGCPLSAEKLQPGHCAAVRPFVSGPTAAQC